MHELSICYGLLAQLEKISQEHGAARVTAIVLRIGPLSGVEAGLLCRAYPLAAAGTIAADAVLAIEPADVVVRCERCDAEAAAPQNRLTCPHCGDFRTRVVSGDEIVLQRVELEYGPRHHAPDSRGDLAPASGHAGRR